MWKWIKRGLLALSAVLVVLLAVVGFNTMRYNPPQIEATKPVELAVDVDRAAQNLSAAVRFETDSTKPDSPDFDAFLTWLSQTYPQVHCKLSKILLNGKTPLY